MEPMLMKIPIIASLFIIVSTTAIFSQNELTPYVDFLNEQQSPKEYIFGLWEEADIIVLGERDHRDTTQYNLILDILSDKRFIENVGNLYLEVGVVNATDKANEVIKGNYANPADFCKKFVELQMEEIWAPFPWENHNRYQLIWGLTQINQNLPEDKKITLGLFDMEFSWDNMTVEKYRKFKYEEMNKEYNTRDKIMADNFLSLYASQPPRNGAKKALIITNREYAGKFNVICKGKDIKRQAGYIKDIYGEKVRTVALNWYKWIPLWDAREKEYHPNLTNELSVDGKWDAVFELTNHKPVGFNLEDTPFGKDEYDYPFDNHLKWEDVFDGFIFYEPYYNFTSKAGMPCQLSTKQAKEIVRRLKIYDEVYGNRKNVRLLKWFGWFHKYQLKKDYSKIRELPCTDGGFYPNSSAWKEDMEKWLPESRTLK